MTGWLSWWCCCCPVPAIFIGLNLHKAFVPSWATWVITAFVLFHLIIELILEIHGCLNAKKQQRTLFFMIIQCILFSTGIVATRDGFVTSYRRTPGSNLVVAFESVRFSYEQGNYAQLMLFG